MLTGNRFRLLFFIINHQKTIFRATGWQVGDLKEGTKIKPARRVSGRDHRTDVPDADLFLVDLHLKLIQALDQNSVDQKFASAATTFKTDNAVSKRTLPLDLSDSDIKSWARRQKMTRIEAVLLSLGFLLRDDLRSTFESLIFSRRDHGTFTRNVEFFPLIEAFLERDEALARSDVFGRSHEIFRHQKASSLEIFEWLSRMDYTLPNGLLSAVRRYNSVGTQEASVVKGNFKDHEIASVNPKTLASLYTIIHAMAAKKPYSFEPGSTAAQSKIETAILDAGLNMSPKTIRKHLDDAARAVQEIKEKNQ